MENYICIEKKDLLTQLRKYDNQDVLFIIGNGFDLYHELRTGYSDFKSFISNSSRTDFNQLFNRLNSLIGKDSNELWSDFEKQLFYLRFFYNKKYHIDNTWEIDELKQKLNELLFIAENLMYSFSAWTYFIYYSNFQKLKDPFLLDLFATNKKFFINFNYTKTLEYVYKIDDSNILHIHGKGLSIYDNIGLIRKRINHRINNSDSIQLELRKYVKNFSLYSFELLHGLIEPTKIDEVRLSIGFNKSNDVYYPLNHYLYLKGRPLDSYGGSCEEILKNITNKTYVDNIGYIYNAIGKYYDSHNKYIFNMFNVNGPFERTFDNRNFKAVVTLGHSIGEPDIPYFQKILDYFPNIEWFVSNHGDVQNLQKMCSQLSLIRSKVHTFYF